MRRLSGGRTVHNDPAEIAEAANTFRGVLTAQHFKHRIHAFSMGHVFDRFFVITLLVIDPVLQPQRFHSRQFFFRRRGPVHLDAEQLSNLHRGRSHSAGHGMNKNSRRRLTAQATPADPAFQYAKYAVK